MRSDAEKVCIVWNRPPVVPGVMVGMAVEIDDAPVGSALGVVGPLLLHAVNAIAIARISADKIKLLIERNTSALAGCNAKAVAPFSAGKLARRVVGGNLLTDFLWCEIALVTAASARHVRWAAR